MKVTCLMCGGLKGRAEEGTVESGPYFVPCPDCNASGEVSIAVAADQQRQIDAWEAADAAYAEAYPEHAGGGIMDDYTYEDALGYDADFSDAKQYCRHGTWIGSWWGPDYMCFKCEMGIEQCHVCGKESEVASSWRLAEEVAFDQRRGLVYSDDDKWWDYICYECLMKRERERISKAISALMAVETLMKRYELRVR